MKRNLLSVSKACYWWIKPHVKIYAVPWTPDGSCTFGNCLICPNHPGKEDWHRNPISKVSLDRVDNVAYVQCDYGHKTVCHKIDLVGLPAGVRCPRENCQAALAESDKPRRRKRPKTIIL